MGKTASKIAVVNEDAEDSLEKNSKHSQTVGKSTSIQRTARSANNVVRMMLPVYYVENNRTSTIEIALAKEKWGLILDNKSPHFVAMQGRPGYEQATCISLFYDKFYSRFFDIHPLAKSMFTAGLKSQGRFLVQMMSLTLGLADKDDKFEDAMIKLAEVHNKRGVKALEYGIVGEVLFWTLRHCLGPDYDSQTHQVWVKLFSRMLSIIVPNAVRFEMQFGEAQVERMREIQSVIHTCCKDNSVQRSSHSQNHSQSHSIMDGFQLFQGFHYDYHVATPRLN